jgi:hypothetical protein
MTRILATLIIGLALSGCGHYGPPERRSSPVDEASREAARASVAAPDAEDPEADEEKSE